MILNKIVRCIFICLAIASAGCDSLDIKQEKESPPGKVRLAQEVRCRTAYKLMKEHGLIPCGSGGGAIDQIEMLALSFDYRKPLSIEEGRRLVLIAVHALVDAVNADERIRPYLIEYPFSPKRIEIAIFVQDAKGHSLKNSEADIFGCYYGTCRYKQMNAKQTDLIVLLQETVEEAESKMQTHAL